MYWSSKDWLDNLYDDNGTAINISSYNNAQNLNPEMGLSSGLAATNLNNLNNNGTFWFDKNGNFNWGNGLGVAMGTAQLGLGAYNTILAAQAQKLAKQQFNFQKSLATTNLNNSVKEYNTKLGDVARTRSIMETGSDGAYSDWYNQNKASSTLS